MPLAKTRAKYNKFSGAVNPAFAFAAVLAFAAFMFTGCMSADEGPAINRTVQSGILTVTGKFAVAAAPASGPSLSAFSSALSPMAASRVFAPSYALLGATAEVALRDLNTGLVLATAVTDASGRFQFTGSSFRGRSLALEIKSSGAQIIIGKISPYLPDNSVISVSKTGEDIDEYFVIASNVAKAKGTADNFTVGSSNPEVLLDMVGKLKLAGATYMYQNPSVDLKKILTESSNINSAVTVGVLQNVPAGEFIGFELSALTPQRAGEAIKITAVARDIFGNAVKNYAGQGTLSIAGVTGSAVWLGADVTNSSNGSASFGQSSFISGSAVFYLTNTAADAERQVTVTDKATGRSGRVKVSWSGGSADHFEITVPAAVQTAGVPFNVTITAKNSSGATASDFTGEVTLANSDLRILPRSAAGFVAGVWQGSVTVFKAAPADRISVSYGAAQGVSANFEVAPAQAAKLGVIDQPVVPQTAGLALGAFQVGIYDTYENLLKNESRAQISAARGSAGISALKGALVKTAVNGVATFNDLRYEKAEIINVRFNLVSNPSMSVESGQFMISPAAAAKLDIGRAPSLDITAGAAFATQPLIYICDIYGNRLNGGSSHVVKAQTGSIGTASLAGKTEIVSIDGAAEFTDLSYPKAGNFNIKFSSGDLAPVETALIKSQASVFDNFEIIPVSASAGASGEILLELKARDANGNYITGYSGSGTLNISGATGTVSWSGTGVIDLGNGRGAFAATAFTGGSAFVRVRNTAPDAVRVVTAVDGATGRGGSATVSWTVGPADHFEVAALSAQTAGKEFALTVTVKDISGNTVKDFIGTVTLSDDTGTITPKTISQFTGGVCQAAAVITRSATSGTVIRAVSGMLQGASAPVAVAPGATSRLEITRQPYMAGAGAAMSPGLQAALYDANGNLVVTDNTSQISVSIAGQPQGVLKGSTVKAVSGGSVSFDDLAYQTAENIILTVSAAGLAPVSSAPVQITPGAPSKLVVVQRPDNDIRAGVPFAKSFKVALCDAFYNLNGGDNSTKISMEQNSGGSANIGGVVSRSVVGGVAEFSGVFYKKAETVAFVFKAEGGADPVESEPYAVAPGAAHSLLFLQPPQSSIRAGDVFDPYPRVAVCDAYSNVIVSDNSTSIAVIASTGDNTKLAPASYSVTTENGVAAFTRLSYKKTGQLKLKFTPVSGATAAKSVESDLITVTGGEFNRFVIVSNTAQPQAAGEKIILKVTACDREGNAVEDFNSGGSLAVSGANGSLAWSGTGVTHGASQYSTYSGGAFAKGVALIELSNTAADANAVVTITDSSSNTSESSIVSWKNGPLDHFEVAADGQPVAGSFVNLRITARDRYLNAVKDYAGSGTLSLTGATGTITWSSAAGVAGSNYTAAAFSQGVANISVKNTAADANLAMKITDSASLRTGSASLTWTSGPLYRFDLSAVPASIAAGSDISLTVTAKDANGNTVRNFSGQLLISDTTATVSPATLVGFVNGVAVSVFKITKAQNSVKITVTDAVNSKTAETNAFNVTAGPFKSIVVDALTAPSQVTAGANFSLTVKAYDEYNNPTNASGQIVAAIGSAGSAEYLKGSLISSINGTSVAFSQLKYEKSENFKVKFSASGVSDAESPVIACVPGTRSYLKVLVHPSASALAGSAFQQQPSVALCDVYGNVISSENVISVKAEADTGSAVKALGGVSTVRLVNGVADFTDLNYTSAGQIKVKFTADAVPALSSVYSNYVTVSAGVASKLSWVNSEEPSSTQYRNLPFNPEIRVAVCDSYGNIILGDNFTVVKASKLLGSGTLTGEVEVTAAGGVSKFSNLLYDTAGTMKIRFTSGSFTSLDSSNITVNP